MTKFSEPVPNMPISSSRKASGRVFDAETGQPVPEFYLATGEIIESSGAMDWSMPIPRTQGNYIIRLNLFEQTGETSRMDPSQPGQPLDRNQFRIRVVAAGYAWAESDPIDPEGPEVVTDFRLQKRIPPMGNLLGVDGKPASGILIRFTFSSFNRYYSDGPRGHICKTNEQGQFEYPEAFDPIIGQVSSEEGYVSFVEDPAHPAVTLQIQKWGAIEGLVRIGTGSLPESELTLVMCGLDGVDFTRPYTIFVRKTHHSMRGTFHFDHVPPGTGRLTWKSTSLDWPEVSRSTYVNVEPGCVTKVRIGATGTTLRGRIKIPESVTETVVFPPFTQFTLKSGTPKPTINTKRLIHFPNSHWRYVQKCRQLHRWGNDPKNFDIQVKAKSDGSFSFIDIPSISSELNLSFRQGLCPHYPDLVPLSGKLSRVLPPVPQGLNYDLGALELDMPHYERPTVGKFWAGIDHDGFEGQTEQRPPDRRISLVHFWAPWHPASIEELTIMKRIFNEFGSDPRFRMQGGCFTENDTILEVYKTRHHLTWEQIPMKTWIQDEVVVNPQIHHLPVAVLSSPEQRIIATDLHGEAVYEAVKKMLQP